MTAPADLVFLFDVDNTLFDNDCFQADLSAHLLNHAGEETCDRYWVIFEQLRSALGYADYLGALQGVRLEALHNPKLPRIANWILDYPLQDRLYPNAIPVVQAAQRAGTTAILSDGDAVFQPHKIEKSGLGSVFGGNVLIYIHKELELADVENHFPAKHYVMIDDKLHLLDAIKRIWADRVTTVFPRQGHYAADAKILSAFPPADITIDHIGDLLNFDLAALVER
jgi:FMN phosphatase YigB (HAD superfamily)